MDVRPVIAGSDTPLFVDNDALWLQYKITPEKTVTPPGPAGDAPDPMAHPVMVLMHLYREATFEYAEASSVGSSYTCQVNLAGRLFDGAGKNKKMAKLAAAKVAVDTLSAEGVLEQRQVEVDATRAARHAKRDEQFLKRRAIIDQRKADRQSRGQNNPPAPKNAVSRLYSLGVRPSSYTLVAEGSAGFTIGVAVRGQTYLGSGMSKRRAKHEAAESALKGIGEWNEEDEVVKRDIIEKDNQKHANAIAAGDAKKMNMASRDGNISGKKMNMAPKQFLSGGTLNVESAQTMEENPLVSDEQSYVMERKPQPQEFPGSYYNEDVQMDAPLYNYQ